MLLNSLSNHIQLQKLYKTGDDRLLFPVNTIDDVIVNDKGDTLKNFLITVDNDPVNPTERLPFALMEHGTDSILDHLLNSIILEKWSGFNTYSDLSEFTYDFLSKFTYDELANAELK